MVERFVLMEALINYNYATVCNAASLFLSTLQCQTENWNCGDLGLIVKSAENVLVDIRCYL